MMSFRFDYLGHLLRQRLDLAAGLVSAGLVLGACHEGELGPKELPLAGAGGGGHTSGGSGGAVGGSAFGGGGAGGEGCAPVGRDAVLALTMDERVGALIDPASGIECTALGAPSYGHPGLRGNAVGLASVDGFDCGDPSALSNLTGLTVAAWVRADEVPQMNDYLQGFIVGKTKHDVGDGGFGLRTGDAAVLFIIDAEDPDGRQYVASSAPLRAREWMHVAGVFDGSSLRIYVDGVLDTAVGASGVIPGGPAPLIVGNSARTTCGDVHQEHDCRIGFDGLMDDVRIYDRALSPEEIAELAAWQGWVTYVSDASGAPEIWATRDDGSRTVQVTDGILGGLNGRYLLEPTIAWDGRHIAAIVQQSPYGGADSYHVYVMASDGSELAAVADVGHDAHGFSWHGDSRRIVYSEQHNCSEDLISVDALRSCGASLLFDGQPAPHAPDISPIDDDLVVFSGMTCGESPWLIQQLDLGTGVATPLADLPPFTLEARWSYAGDKLAYVTFDSAQLRILRWGESTSTIVANEADAASLLGARFGNGGRRIYLARADLDTGQADLVWFDVETGAKTTLVTNLPTGGSHMGHSWGIFPFEIDRDDDGLANGIDPTPDG